MTTYLLLNKIVSTAISEKLRALKQCHTKLSPYFKIKKKTPHLVSRTTENKESITNSKQIESQIEQNQILYTQILSERLMHRQS